LSKRIAVWKPTTFLELWVVGWNDDVGPVHALDEAVDIVVGTEGRDLVGERNDLASLIEVLDIVPVA